MPVGRYARGSAPGAGALLALPLVGAAIGALGGGAGLLASLALPLPLAAAVALGTVIVLSGAIHIDGFLDGCDAFFASVSPQRRLEILKDPHHGTFAVAGMFVVGSLWFAALVSLPPKLYPELLAFTGALARAAAVPNAFAFPRAGAGGTALSAARPPLVALAAICVALALVGYAVSPRSALLVPFALVLALFLGRTLAKRLGGVLTGDAYGFIIVVVEVSVLAVLVAAGTRPG